MMKVLFVCTANVFRSLSAHKLFNQYAKQNNLTALYADSAGTFEKTQGCVDPVVIETLSTYGIDASEHRPKQLQEEHFTEYDLVVAMAKSHQRFIKERFNKEVILYNEFGIGKATSVDDVDDIIREPEHHKEQVDNHIRKTIAHIHDTMHNVVGKLTQKEYRKK